MRRSILLAWSVALIAGFPARGSAQPARETLPVRITWGHRSPAGTTFAVAVEGHDISITAVEGLDLEPGEGRRDGAWTAQSGGGDVDGLRFVVEAPARAVEPLKKLHPIWHDLIVQSDLDTARRLRLDPAIRRDSRRLTVRLGRDGLRGFSVTVDQLQRERAFWVPALDLFVAVGDDAPGLEQHVQALAPWKGSRILDRVHRQPEATYAEFTARWEDMGNPSYVHPNQPVPGHVVCLTWDSAIPKFGIDRGAGVWSDFGNPDQFRFWFGFAADLARLRREWKGQGLRDGLPIVWTDVDQDGIRYAVEEFAHPLNGPPAERKGDIPMVLLQRLVVTNSTETPRKVSLTAFHAREIPRDGSLTLTAAPDGGQAVLQSAASRDVLLTIQGEALKEVSLRERAIQPGEWRGASERARVAEITAVLELPPRASKELIIKLPSPPVRNGDRDRLLRLDYRAACDQTRRFWSDLLARGTRFEVPEKVVNDLFRANLWHALTLPRRHGGAEPGVAIDFPYSNFAYDQKGTPWPINQAVYVDEMIHDLRGYHEIAREDLLTIYRTNQEPSGRVGGYAHWGAYTPGMLHASARHFLLSQDRAGFARLLPPTLRAMDWCLAELRKASKSPESAGGLVRIPLNDLTGEGFWAFNQAYLHAGLAALGQALERIGHPRAAECREAANQFQAVVEAAFARAAVQSPLVQLRDHTWSPYVPSEARASGRLMEQWYPTDVDTGAMHLLRLGTISSRGELADAMLNDHEDNLYLKGWGMANEPIYNPQSMAYVFRDDPQAMIRSFYSYLACAFSHSALVPVEHRWTWGQYFGPPSTDGAWFELYRNMLVRELEDGGLLLFQATPRAWLEAGKRVAIERAPTTFGKVSARISRTPSTEGLEAAVEVPAHPELRRLLVRFRHPAGKAMRSVRVNGREWSDFDARREWVRIEPLTEPRYVISISY